MLFSFVARGVRALQGWPRIVILLNLAICIALLWPISRMEWKLSITDLLSPTVPSREAAELVERKFGGLGTLTMVVQSPDSAINAQMIRSLADSLEHQALVNFTEYRTEADFYRQHQLLYIRLGDLESIRDRIHNRIDAIKAKHNPMLVQLDSTTAPTDTVETPLSLADLEAKYLHSLRPYIGNADGSIQVLEIYPKHALNDLEKNRSLLNLTNALLAKHPLHQRVKVYYTGKVFENASTSGVLLKEIRRIGWISAGMIFLFMLMWFIRQPQVPLVAVVPLGLSMIWTIGCNALLFGSMNFFTLLLFLIVPGLAANHLTHFLTHYADERRRGLGPDLALESTVLGIGPVITVVSVASAIAFFALALLPLAGLRQLGISGGLAVLFNWASIVLFLPILLTLLQRRNNFRIFGNSRPLIDLTKPTAFHDWKRFFPVLVFLTILLASNGVLPQFEYDFSKLSYAKPSQKANSLLRESGIPYQEPAVVLTSGSEQSRKLLEILQRRTPDDSSRTIQRIVSFASLLPADQNAKLAILQEIHDLLTPQIIASLSGQDSITVARIMTNWNTQALTEKDLPQSVRRKFLGRDSSLGEFTFIFPSIDVENGRECRRFARDVRNIVLDSNTIVHATSTAILQADLLDQSLPWMGRSFLVVVLSILLLVLFYVERPYRALFVILPPVFGFIWFLSALRLMGIALNPWSTQVIPLLVGISISGSLHLWYQYREKSTGSVIAVLRHTGPTVIAATFSVIICFSGLLFSSLPGLRSMGLVAVLGLLCLGLAHLTLFPLLVGWLDWHRLQNQNLRSK